MIEIVALIAWYWKFVRKKTCKTKNKKNDHKWSRPARYCDWFQIGTTRIIIVKIKIRFIPNFYNQYNNNFDLIAHAINVWLQFFSDFWLEWLTFSSLTKMDPVSLFPRNTNLLPYHNEIDSRICLTTHERSYLNSLP